MSIHSLQKYLLINYYVPDTVSDTRKTKEKIHMEHDLAKFSV